MRLAPVVVEGSCFDNEPWRAEAALQRVERHERALDRMQCRSRDALDRGDAPARRGLCRHQTAHDGDAVDQYGAGDADTRAADELGPGQAQPTAQDIDEKRIGL